MNACSSAGADRERRERERDGQRDVIAGRPRRGRARVGGMRFVDPDRAVHQPAQLVVVRARLELQEQAVARRTSAARHGRRTCRRASARSALRLSAGAGSIGGGSARWLRLPGGRATAAVRAGDCSPPAVPSASPAASRRRPRSPSASCPEGTLANSGPGTCFVAAAGQRQSLLTAGAADRRAIAAAENRPPDPRARARGHARGAPCAAARRRRARRPTPRAGATRLPGSPCDRRGRSRRAGRCG